LLTERLGQMSLLIRGIIHRSPTLGGVAMNLAYLWMSVGLAFLLSPPQANCQDGKGPRFTDVTTSAGVVVEMQSKGVDLFDLDNDGFLDVFVAERGDGQVGKGIVVADFDKDGRPDVFVVGGTPRDRLYRNRGNGTFEEITRGVTIETIKIEGGKVEITGQSIKVEGGKVEIIRRKP